MKDHGRPPSRLPPSPATLSGPARSFVRISTELLMNSASPIRSDRRAGRCGVIAAVAKRSSGRSRRVKTDL